MLWHEEPSASHCRAFRNFLSIGWSAACERATSIRIRLEASVLHKQTATETNEHYPPSVRISSLAECARFEIHFQLKPRLSCIHECTEIGLRLRAYGISVIEVRLELKCFDLLQSRQQISPSPCIEIPMVHLEQIFSIHIFRFIMFFSLMEIF